MAKETEKLDQKILYTVVWNCNLLKSNKQNSIFHMEKKDWLTDRKR